MHLIKSIPVDLLELDQIPQLGEIPSFPLSAFADQLKERLKLEDFTIERGRAQWTEEAKCLEGFGNERVPLTFTLPPLEGTATLVFGRGDIQQFMHHLLFADPPTQPDDPDFFCDPFTHFLTLLGIDAFQKCGFPLATSLQTRYPAQVPKEHCFTVDLVFKIEELTLFGRLLLDPPLTQALRKQFSLSQREALLSEQLKNLPVSLLFQGGTLEMTQKDWEELNVGDILLFEQCSLSPDFTSGEVDVLFEQFPLFRGKVEDDKLTLLPKKQQAE